MELAQRLGIDLNENRFAQTASFTPVETSRAGVYVCGALQGPKDIPQSVMEASAAASASALLLSDSRWTQATIKEKPVETNVVGEPPRVGVFVCQCGINIGGVVKVPEVREYARISALRRLRGRQSLHLFPGHPGQDGRGHQGTGHQPGGGGGLHPANP